MAHNNRKLFQGHCVNISVFGLSFCTPTELHSIGSKLNLHIKPSHELSPFNVICEVTSVHRVSSPKNERMIKYGVRFLKVAPEIQEEIHALTQKHKMPVAA